MTARLDGCRVGQTWGTHWHGSLESDGFRRAFLREVAAAAGRRFVPAPDTSFAALREEQLDRLGDLIEQHADTDALWRLIESGAPQGLPFIPPGRPPRPACRRATRRPFEYPILHGRRRPGRPAARAAAQRRVARRSAVCWCAARRAPPSRRRYGRFRRCCRRSRSSPGCRFSCDPARARPGVPRRAARGGDGRSSGRPAWSSCPSAPPRTGWSARSTSSGRSSEGVKAFEPGLLADAHRGILYVDEVNLLHDHLVDLLLDAAAMGASYVEREGVSVRHAARSSCWSAR